jgi:hypothetical protein
MNARDIDPEKLTASLIEAGFTLQGVRANVAFRLRWPQGSGVPGSLIVPLDRSAPDYDELMDCALAMLRNFVRSGQDVFAALFRRGIVEVLDRP